MEESVSKERQEKVAFWGKVFSVRIKLSLSVKRHHEHRVERQICDIDTTFYEFCRIVNFMDSLFNETIRVIMI